MEICRVTQVEAVNAAGHLFDTAPGREATERFLTDECHHFLIAYVDGVPAGIVTGVEMTRPDKGTEMFLYELGVDGSFRGRGVGRALVSALADLSREQGCYGVWTITDEENAAALATYSRAGGLPENGTGGSHLDIRSAIGRLNGSPSRIRWLELEDGVEHR